MTWFKMDDPRLEQIKEDGRHVKIKIQKVLSGKTYEATARFHNGRWEKYLLDWTGKFGCFSPVTDMFLLLGWQPMPDAFEGEA